MPASTIPYPILDPTRSVASRAGLCALAVMAKAPRAGKVKTRLAPPLTLEQAATINISFLRDTTENIATIAASGRAAGVVSYTPVGDEAAFEGLLPGDFALIPQRGGGFGDRLFGSAQDLLACGYGSACLIDSDSPTVPAQAFEQAVAALERSGDRIVVGPAYDGGYYLIGLKADHPEIFSGISWSTSRVFGETVAAAIDAGVEVCVLPMWYDVDDAESLDLLEAELLGGVPPVFTTIAGYPAGHTRAFLRTLERRKGESR